MYKQKRRELFKNMINKNSSFQEWLTNSDISMKLMSLDYEETKKKIKNIIYL